VLPRRFRSSALRACGAVGLPSDTWKVRAARGPQRRHGDDADRKLGARSYPQFIAMVSDATSA
jgi:hypothetical protein